MSKGADVHLTANRGITLLQEAAVKGLSKVVEELLRKKVYVNEKDDDGSAALGRRSLSVSNKVQLFEQIVYLV